MGSGRVKAVDHVFLQAPLGMTSELEWFYREVGGLEPASADGEASRQLCFKSERLELRIDLVDDPRIDRVARRLTVLVPLLEEAITMLEEHDHPYNRISGLMATDRRVGTYDPAGNRVELKQEWPRASL